MVFEISDDEKRSEQVSFRVSRRQLEIIDNLCAIGLFKDRSQFWHSCFTQRIEQILGGKDPDFEDLIRRLKVRTKALDEFVRTFKKE